MDERAELTSDQIRLVLQAHKQILERIIDGHQRQVTRLEQLGLTLEQLRRELDDLYLLTVKHPLGYRAGENSSVDASIAAAQKRSQDSYADEDADYRPQ
jgi:hypothetical protein